MPKPKPRASWTGVLRAKDSDLLPVVIAVAWGSMHSYLCHQSIELALETLRTFVPPQSHENLYLSSLHGYLIGLSKKVPLNQPVIVKTHKLVQGCYLINRFPCSWQLFTYRILQWEHKAVLLNANIWKQNLKKSKIALVQRYFFSSFILFVP